MKVERIYQDEDEPFCRIKLTRREVRDLRDAMGDHRRLPDNHAHHKLYVAINGLLEGKCN